MTNRDDDQLHIGDLVRPQDVDPNETRDFADRLVGSEPVSIAETLVLPSDATDPAGPSRIDRADVLSESLRSASGWALRFIVIAVATFILWRGMSMISAALLPVFATLIVCTVLWPPVALLSKWRFPRALAVAISMLGSLGIVGGIFALITPPMVEQSDDLVSKFSIGLRRVQDWLQGPPVNLQDSQLNSMLDQATGWLQDQASNIAGYAVNGLSTASNVLVNMVVVLVLTFFFLKDGDKFLPWLRGALGQRLGWHMTEALTRSWSTLSGYIRAQALVSLVDAVFIGLGLIILKVPLALAIAVLTFFAGFIPIIGAFSAGVLAVLVALVTNGFTNALLVLALVVLVQQLEGNILSPFLQSKAMNLHPVIVMLSVTVGTGLFGIIGAFLAVPIVAIVAVWLRYFSDLTDLRTGDKTLRQIQFATVAGQESGKQSEEAGRRKRKLIDEQKRRVSEEVSDDEHSESEAAPTVLERFTHPATDVFNRLFLRKDIHDEDGTVDSKPADDKPDGESKPEA
nr:AI-2E family transporter [Corynebacterium ulceribovis]